MGRNNCVDKRSVKKYKKGLCYPFRSVDMCIMYYYARSGHNSAPFWLYRLGVINECLAVKHDIALIYNDFQANGDAKKRGAKDNGS